MSKWAVSLKVRTIIILSLVLFMILSVKGLSFAQLSDIQGHWAGKQISDWVNKGLAKDIPQWSKGSVGAVVARGLMNGYHDQTYQPAKLISRAEAIETLDRANTGLSKTVTYNKAGTYGPASGMETIDGDVYILVSGITLQNIKITGNLNLVEGIGDGDVTLKNVTVQGNTTIKGGGANSIHLEDCTLPSITISKEGVRVVASGNTSVNVVRLESGATLVEVTATGPGFEAVTVAEVVPASAQVTLSGNFNDVNVAAEKVKVDVSGGTVANLEVDEKATGATINLAEAAKVSTLTINAAVSVTGKGTIETAKVNVNGSTIEQNLRT